MIIPFYYKIIAFGLILGTSCLWSYNKGLDKSDRVIANYEQENKRINDELQIEKLKIKEKVITKYVDRIITVEKERSDVVDIAKNTVPQQNQLSEGWIYTYNYSTKNQEISIDSLLSANILPSGIFDNQALSVIVDNNSVCRKNYEQVLALQEYNRELENKIKEFNLALQKTK